MQLYIKCILTGLSSIVCCLSGFTENPLNHTKNDTCIYLSYSTLENIVIAACSCMCWVNPHALLLQDNLLEKLEGDNPKLCNISAKKAVSFEIYNK